MVDVERQLNQETANDLDKHRNGKKTEQYKTVFRKTQQKSGTSNVADQIICVEEMTKTHEFVRRVMHLHGLNHPVITLFTNR